MNRREREARDAGLIARGVDRIELTWYRALRAGVPGGWYRDANRAIRELHPAHPVLAVEVAAVLAPRQKWQDVIGALPAALALDRKALRRFLPDGRARARRLIRGEPWDDVVPPGRAPKTRDFRDALLGDLDAPVVDVWASRVVGIPVPNATRYAVARRAYVEAARALGVGAAELQARTWSAVRDHGVALPR